jgi:Domain of unknown function (DUF2019)
MTRANVEDMRIDQLVEQFTVVAAAEYDALEKGDREKFRGLFRQMTDVMNELKSRPIEQRRALMALYQHPNPQVRYEAAFATSDFAAEAARLVFEIIIERNEYPQAADARGMIRELDKRGTASTR